MNYRLDCPHCSGPIAVQAAKAGGQLPCPRCGGDVDVPRLGDLKRLPPMPEAERGEVGKKTSDGSREFDSPLPLAILGLIATAALLVAGYAGLRWALTEVDMTTEEHLQVYRENYSELPAAVLIQEYERMERYGLELPIPTPYIQQAKIRTQWGNTAAAAAVVLALSVVGMILVARRGSKAVAT